MVGKLMGKYCKIYPIAGMEIPKHYRNKVHAVFDRDKTVSYTHLDVYKRQAMVLKNGVRPSVHLYAGVKGIRKY